MIEKAKKTVKANCAAKSIRIPTLPTTADQLKKSPDKTNIYEQMFDHIAHKWCGTPVYINRPPTKDDNKHLLGETWLDHKGKKVYILCGMDEGKAQWEVFHKKGLQLTQ